MKNQINKSAKYFRNVTVTFTTSSRRNGGYFSYSDEKIENAIMLIESGCAVITSPVTESQLYGPFQIAKMLHGKYFKIVKSTEITKRQYLNDLNKFKKQVERNREIAAENHRLEQKKQELVRDMFKKKIAGVKEEFKSTELGNLWFSVDKKRESGLSWYEYRNFLKAEFAAEWPEFKQKMLNYSQPKI